MKKHAVRIEAPHGRYFSSKVFIDGQEMRGVYGVHVDIDHKVSPDVLVTLMLGVSELIVEGEGVVTLVGAARPPQLTDGQEDA